MRHPGFLLLVLLVGWPNAMPAQSTTYLILNPLPSGSATVLIDGTNRGTLQQRRRQFAVTPGPRRVVVRTPDGREFDTTVVIPARGLLDVTVHLPPAPRPAPPPAPRPVQVRLLPAGLDLSVGDSAAIGVTTEVGGRGAPPGLLSPISETPRIVRAWPLSNDSFAVLALAAGEGRVRVRAGGGEAVLAVRVRPRREDVPPPPSLTQPPPVTGASSVPVRLAVQNSPSELRFLVGEPGAVRVIGVRADSLGVAVPIRYRSYDPAIALIDSVSGAVTARAVGTAVIGYEAPGYAELVGTVQLVVEGEALLPAADTAFLMQGVIDSARVAVGGSNPRAYRGPLQWESEDSTIVFVGPQSGTLEAVGVGAARVRARAGPATSVQWVRVVPRYSQYGPPAGPGDTLVVPIGGQLPVALWAQDSAGNRLFPIPMEWEIRGVAAHVDRSSGLMTGEREGDVLLSARKRLRDGFGEREWRWPVKVVGGAIRLAPPRLTVRAGRQDSLRPMLLDAQGRPTGFRPEVEWSAAPEGVVRVGLDGAVEGLRIGHAVIRAVTRWDSSATATVLVAPDILYFLAADPRNPGVVTRLRLRHLDSGSIDIPIPDVDLSCLPSVSPDGSQVALLRKNEQGGGSLWLMDIDGSGMTRAPSDRLSVRQPVWARDGKGMYYLAMNGGAGQVFLSPLDGRVAQPVSEAGLAVRDYGISPRGSWLILSAKNGLQYDLFLVPLRNGLPTGPVRSSPVRVTAGVDEISPQVSEDGTTLYFIERKHGDEARSVLRRWVLGELQPTSLTPEDLYVMNFTVRGDGRELLVSGKRRNPAGGTTALYMVHLEQGRIGDLVQVDADLNGQATLPAYVP